MLLSSRCLPSDNFLCLRGLGRRNNPSNNSVTTAASAGGHHSGTGRHAQAVNIPYRSVITCSSLLRTIISGNLNFRLPLNPLRGRYVHRSGGSPWTIIITTMRLCSRCRGGDVRTAEIEEEVHSQNEGLRKYWIQAVFRGDGMVKKLACASVDQRVHQ